MTRGLRGAGGTVKHCRPRVKVVVGQGRPKVGVCGYGWPAQADQTGYTTMTTTISRNLGDLIYHMNRAIVKSQG